MFFFNMYESLYLTKLTTNYLTNFFYIILNNDHLNSYFILYSFSLFSTLVLFYNFFIYNKPKNITIFGIELGLGIPKLPIRYYITIWCIVYLLLHMYYPMFLSVLMIYMTYYIFYTGLFILLFVCFLNSLNFDRRYIKYNKFYYLADMYILFIESQF